MRETDYDMPNMKNGKTGYINGAYNENTER